MSRTFPLRELARMKAAHLKVMLALLDHDTYRDGACSPALRWIAAHGQLSLAAVQRAVKEMAALAYIAVEPGRGRSFRYLVAERFRRILEPVATDLLPDPGDRALRDTGATGAARVGVAARRGGASDPSPTSGTQSPPGGTQSPAGGTEEEGNPPEYVLTTETVAARARETLPAEAIPNLDSGSLSRFARPDPREAAVPPPRDEAQKRAARDRWLELLCVFVNTRYGNDEAKRDRFFGALYKPPKEARPVLNQFDDEMRQSTWWRERQASLELRRAGGTRR